MRRMTGLGLILMVFTLFAASGCEREPAAGAEQMVGTAEEVDTAGPAIDTTFTDTTGTSVTRILESETGGEGTGVVTTTSGTTAPPAPAAGTAAESTKPR